MIETLIKNYEILLILIVFAMLSGFFAGLFGAGGGMIIVPSLFYAFKIMNYDEQLLMHLAVATSLAIIIPTSIISSYTHYRLGNIDKKLLKYLSVFIIIGIVFGSILTINLNTVNLLTLFSFYTLFSGIFLFIKKDKDENISREIPNFLKCIYGIITGFVSVPLGIGGASIMVPIMKYYNYSIKIAIGTSAHIGIIISISAVISLAFGGELVMKTEQPFTLGYINLLGLIIFAPITIFMAPIGAKLVYRIDKKILNKLFGIVLVIISLRSFYEVLNL